MSIDFKVDWRDAAQQLGMKEKELKPILREALIDSGKRIKEDFERPTKTWNHRVTVEVLTEIRGWGVEMIAGTDDKIWGMLEKGTKPHNIFPKRAKALRFMSGHHPKTTPGSLFAGAGGYFGNVVFSKGVRHPGTKPRRWLPVIKARADKFLAYAVKSRLARWAR